MSHQVAQNIRNQQQFYRQYEMFRQVREAARINLDRQFAVFRIGGVPTDRINYLQVLLAVTDWGNSVSSEANSLMRYNTELANLERQIGTIIEDHGIQFYEERYSSLSVLQKCGDYAESVWPADNQPVYDAGDEPAEEFFDLKSSVPKAGTGRPGGDVPTQPRKPTLPDPMRLLDSANDDADRDARPAPRIQSPTHQRSNRPLRLPNVRPTRPALPCPATTSRNLSIDSNSG